MLLIRRSETNESGEKGKKHYYLQPNAETVLQMHDILLIFGEKEAIDQFDKM